MLYCILPLIEHIHTLMVGSAKTATRIGKDKNIFLNYLTALHINSSFSIKIDYSTLNTRSNTVYEDSVLNSLSFFQVDKEYILNFLSSRPLNVR